jgi:hypothetical protein
MAYTQLGLGMLGILLCAWFAVMFFMMLRAVQSHALEEHRVQEPALR